MKEENIEREANHENTNINEKPENRILLNKKLVKEDPLNPYKRIKSSNPLVLILLFIVLATAITFVIYKFVILK